MWACAGVGICVSARIPDQSHTHLPRSPFSLLQKTLLSDKIGGAGVHFIVDNAAGSHMNQFAELQDPVIDHYSSPLMPDGTSIVRLGQDSYDSNTSAAALYRMMGPDDATASALRAKVMADVKALGGVEAKWHKVYCCVSDVGEYGNHDYRRATRWVLAVTFASTDLQSTRGIKRKSVSM